VVSNTTRDAPPLIWPTLRRPDGTAKLIYLDQEDLVHLAQADTGHPDGPRYAAALQAARDARAAWKAGQRSEDKTVRLWDLTSADTSLTGLTQPQTS
jgi:hypothetical protein